MALERRLVLASTASLLHLRGVERWLLEVAIRLGNCTILTFSVGLRDIKDVEKRLIEIKGRLKGVEWHELRALSYESMRAPNSVLRFMRHSGIVVPMDFKIIKLLRGKILYLVVGDAYQATLLAFMAVVAGARRIMLGIHSRPSYKRFVFVKPLLMVMNKLGLLKGVHAVNVADALTLRDILGDIPVWWIPNGVDCNRFKPYAKRIDKFQVLYVGALSEDKGVDTLIETARIVKRRDDIEFLVVSVGGPLRSLVEEARREGIVEFLDFVPDNELAKLYAESHVAVFPSREEAFGLVSLEAQASGTPVIATDLPAFRQSMVNGMTGVLVRPYSPEAFAKAIIEMRNTWLNNRQRYEQMCIAARKNAERFCWERVVRAYLTKFLKPA
jgi:glycosyltransferase involved in cell wall biosynthesis